MKGKRKIVVSVIMFLCLLFTSFGYAALNTELSISGEAYVRVDSDIRITGLKLSSITGGGYESYNSKYSKDTTSMFVTLLSNVSAIYEVEVTNNSSSEYFLKKIISNNSNYEILDSKIYDIFSPGSVKKFRIKINNPSSTTQSISLNLEYQFEIDKNPTIALGDLPSWNTKGDEYAVTPTYNLGPSGGSVSCKSNVNTGIANVTNLSQLTTTGTHNITCTVKSNTGKTASVTQSTKITYDPYSSKNIITNGSFESGVSNVTITGNKIERSTSYAYHGSYSAKLTSVSTAVEAYADFASFNYIKGHIYYYQLYYYIPPSAPSAVDVQLLLVDYTNASIDNLHTDNFNVRGGAIAASYINRPAWSSGRRNFRFDNNNVRNNIALYYDAVVAIDLTATFGSGNEPNKAWCKKHIKYFDGTTTIYK